MGAYSPGDYLLAVFAYDVTTNTGADDIVFTVVPEPATISILVFGFLGIRLRRRRKGLFVIVKT